MRGTATLLLGAVTFCLTALADSPSTPQTKAQAQSLRTGFVVSNIKGTVVARGPISTQWRQVAKGTFLPDFHLVQITRDASLAMYRAEVDPSSKKARRIGSENSGISISTPAIIRVGPDFLRKIDLSRYFIDEMPKLSGATEHEAIPWYMDEAWKRVAAILTSRTEKAQTGVATDLLAATGAGAMGMITILTPRSGSFQTITESPTEVNVAWSPSRDTQDPSTSYKVYVWPQGEERKDPAAITTAESYRVKVQKSGEYLVQIESSDGKSRSIANRIFLGNGKQPEIAKDAPEVDHYAATLSRPVNDSVLWTSAQSAPVRFQWNLFSPSDQELMVLIKRGADVVVYDRVGHRLSTSYLLAPGSYSWQLTWTQANEAPVLGRYAPASDTHTFKIAPSPSTEVAKTVESAIREGQSTIVFLDHF
jgi:hypothetical protein